jgi:ribonucleoside-diphosphate reductase beta chain
MTAKEIKNYIRWTSPIGASAARPASRSTGSPSTRCPGWMPLLNGVEHANFFETRATEYSKAATQGNWNDVWDAFDAFAQQGHATHAAAARS